MRGTIADRILDDRIAALQAIDGSATASSTVDQTCAAGTRVLYIASTTGFVVGEPVIINAGGDREEVTTPVESIDDGESVTLQSSSQWTGLEYEHTADDADAVKQDWFNNDLSGGGQVETWKTDPLPLRGIYPCAGARWGEGASPGKSTGQLDCTEIMQILGWIAVERDAPADQTNDLIYRGLLADFIKALEADFTCGGWAMGLRPTIWRPLNTEDARDPRAAIPLVGCFLQLEIDYQHHYSSLYR